MFSQESFFLAEIDLKRRKVIKHTFLARLEKINGMRIKSNSVLNFDLVLKQENLHKIEISFLKNYEISPAKVINCFILVKNKDPSVFKLPSVILTESLVKKASRIEFIEKQFQRKKIQREAQKHQTHQNNLIKIESEDKLYNRLLKLISLTLTSVEYKVNKILRK